MDFLHDYTETSSSVLDGLHVVNELKGMSNPSSPVSCASRSLHDGHHAPHGPSHSAHTESVRDQLYADLRADLHADLHADLRADLTADLRALLADLEQPHSRIGRNPWGRSKQVTKGLFGSIRRVFSLKARSKSQSAGPQPMPPSESQLAPSTAKPPAVGPAELSECPAPIPELAGPVLDPYHLSMLADESTSMGLFPSNLGSYSGVFGFDQFAHHANVDLAAFPPQPQPWVPRPHEVALQPPNAYRLTTASWYPTPMPPLTTVSPLSPSVTSTGGSQLFSSPYSSISSDSSSYSANATAPAFSELPICASPGGYGEDHNAVAPWKRSQGSWDSTTTMAELADNPSQWLQNAAPGGVPELEAFVPPTNPSAPLFSQQPHGAERWELPTTANAQHNLYQDQLQSSQVLAGEHNTGMADPTPPRACFPARHGHPPLTPRPDVPPPPVSPARQNSVSSIADTVFDVCLSDDDRNPKAAAQPAGHPPNAVIFEALPSQQKTKTRVKKATRVRRRTTTPQEQAVPISCRACNFVPKGPGPRRKMENHMRTNRHRKATEQDVVGRVFLCRRCPAAFNREDNLNSHLVNVHGIRPGDWGLSWRAYHEQVLRSVV